jgi:hypothetical protein
MANRQIKELKDNLVQCTFPWIFFCFLVIRAEVKVSTIDFSFFGNAESVANCIDYLLSNLGDNFISARELRVLRTDRTYFFPLHWHRHKNSE